MNYAKPILVAGTLLLFSCNRETAQPITIFAASSLKETVEDISKQWTGKLQIQTRLQFEASSTLAKQIQEGAPADVFISAAPEWVDKLAPSERMDWLSNRLVCVVPKEVESFDFAKLESLAMANEQVPAGKYAKAALAKLGLKTPERVIYGSNVRDVLSKVSEGGAAAGIVYATDVMVDPRLRIAYVFPADSHPKILYVAALLRPQGKAFFDSLREAWAIEIAEKRGFSRGNEQ